MSLPSIWKSKQEIKMRHLVPCGETPKKPRVEEKKNVREPATSNIVPRLQTTVRVKREEKERDSVLLTIVGKPAQTVDYQKPYIVPNESTSVDYSSNNVQEQDISNTPNEVLDEGRPIIMNRVNLLPATVLQQVAVSGDYWHKITIIRGAGYSKHEIMRALFDALHPKLIAPVMYRQEGNHVSFLIRNGLHPLLQLLHLQMQIPIVTFNEFGQHSHLLDVEVILRHTYIHSLPINVFEHFRACITRRYDKSSQTLDLTAFHMDSELQEMVFWPLWIPRALLHILQVKLKTSFPTIKRLLLAENEIAELPRMSLLANLEMVDLSSNKISRINVLKAFYGTKISDITLDGNPLCAGFSNELFYIKAIREVLPSIKKIDGVYVSHPDLPPWRRNYVPPSQTECIALVDQFLQHYFSLLDRDDRQRLQGIYHPDALFSLTCNFIPGQSTSSTARLTSYTLESRNLYRLSDYSKSLRLISQGAEEVLAALHRLPRTEHDPYSFAVDMPYYTKDTAVIVVNGVFREPSMMNENLVRAFSRTFVLQKVASKEYQIINEMLTVSNASTKQAQESFKYPKQKVPTTKLTFNPAQDLTDADQKQMIKIFSRLTEMNQQWAQECLKQTKWDIKQALAVFTELLEKNKLPVNAFEPEEDKATEKK